MKPGLGLGQKAIQSLTINSQILQTLKIVQYSAAELINCLEHEIAENPFLSEDLKDSNKIALNNSENADAQDYYLEYQDYQVGEKGLASKSRGNDYLDKTSIIEKTTTSDEQLSDVLMDQLRFKYSENSENYRIGEYIIGSLDQDGYLTVDIIPDLIAELKTDATVFHEVLSIIKAFEPSGIASGTLQECLVTQVKELGQDQSSSLEFTLVKDHFHLLEKKKYLEISKLLKVSHEEIELAMHQISLLEPKPSRKYQVSYNFIIIPDVFVQNINGQLTLSLNNGYLPKIRFNDEYKKLLKTKDNPELKQYFLEKQEKAKTLLESIEYRKSNLLKVMEKVIDFQKDFFYQGIKGLKPYTIVELAAQIEVNQGTVSRIINSKYIDTPWGIFSLRIFFSTSIPSKEGSVSSNKIKEMIKEIIYHYEGKKKLSDQKIAEVLSKKGYDISRRTVTKYRSKLTILSSHHR